MNTPQTSAVSTLSEYPVLRAAPAIILVALGAFIIVDYLFFFVVPAQRLIYGVIVLLAAVALLLGLKEFKVTQKSFKLITAWVVFSALFLLPVFLQKHFYLGYVLGDLASVLFPLVMLLVGLRYPEFFSVTKSVPIVMALTLIGVVLGMFFGEYGDRFEAPTSMLFVVAWAIVLFSKSIITRSLGLGALLLLLVIAFESGERTSVILWIICLVLVIFVTLRLTALTGLLVAMTLGVVVIFSGQLINVLIQDIIEQSRFSTAASVDQDQSLLERYDEARDVLLMLETAPSAAHLLGHGHGSAYRPYYSYIQRNISHEGEVHNIHFGPLLVYFRYGAIGFLIYLALVVVSVKAMFRLRRQYSSGLASPQKFVFTLTVVLYLFDWLLRNILVDPLWSYALAGFLVVNLGLWLPVHRTEAK